MIDTFEKSGFEQKDMTDFAASLQSVPLFRLAQAEKDALKSTIEQCWQAINGYDPPAGGTELQKIAAEASRACAARLEPMEQNLVNMRFEIVSHAQVVVDLLEGVKAKAEKKTEAEQQESAASEIVVLTNLTRAMAQVEACEKKLKRTFGGENLAPITELAGKASEKTKSLATTAIEQIKITAEDDMKKLSILSNGVGEGGEAWDAQLDADKGWDDVKDVASKLLLPLDVEEFGKTLARMDDAYAQFSDLKGK